MAILATSRAVSFVAILAILYGPQPALGSSKFLHDHGVNSKAFKQEVMDAMGSMLGCGGQADPQQAAAITATLTPMWRTLPKTSGRIDRRSLRYLIHRYFMQTSSLMVRGFEPTRVTNDSHWGAADILSQMVPAYVESVLEARHKAQHGFTLQDAVDMVLTLDQLIFDSEGALLEDVYREQSNTFGRRLSVQQTLSFRQLKQVLEEYMVRWMIQVEPHEMKMLLANKTLMAEVLPHYNELMKFAEGRIKSFEFSRGQKNRGGGDAWDMRYSFDDAHSIAGGITRSFQSFWQSECESMKSALVDMDSHNTGRVPLAKFYNTAINTDWRFGESEAYLRELGALDESSSWTGPQVIIPNYIQATSNCIVSTPHYLVCCQNECETLLGEIETAIDAPSALPSTIIDVVGKMTSQTTLDDDEFVHLTPALASQLEQVARGHGGMVPLHGRLFAQWLHYVFPRECPFPHKIGAVSSATPAEYAGEVIATQADMRKHASNATALELPSSVGKEELQWMSQWSPDEELIVDYASEVRTPWLKYFLVIAGLVAAAGGISSGAIGVASTSKVQKGAGMVPNSHWV